MHQHTMRRVAGAIALAGLGALAGCAVSGSGGQAAQGAALYRCEHGIEFSARFAEDSAVLEGTRGRDVLLRDAGGQGAQNMVFSSSRLRAEFGLGAGAREALLQYFEPPLRARCLRD